MIHRHPPADITIRLIFIGFKLRCVQATMMQATSPATPTIKPMTIAMLESDIDACDGLHLNVRRSTACREHCLS